MTCGCTKMKKKRQKDCRAPGNRRRRRKWLGRHQEICQNDQTGKRARQGGKKVNGGWSLKGKRKCRKSSSCRMRWEGTFVDLDGESRREQVEARVLEEEEKYSTRVRRVKVQERK